MELRPARHIAFSVGLLIATLTAFRVLATGSAADPFEFFEPSVTMTAGDRAHIDQGAPIARVMPGTDLEVGVWAAVPVNIDADRVVAWMRRIEELKKSTYVLAIGRFSNPPRLDDVARLSLDDQDVSDIMACHPGNCAVKLSEAEMVALQNATGAGSAGLQQRFREVVLDRVNAYLSGSRIGPYADTTSDVWPAQEFDMLLGHMPFLAEHAQQFADSLRGAPAAAMPDHAESFLYWSKEKLGDKPSINVTDVRILRGDNAHVPDVVVAGKQIFATHYIDASLGVTALVHGEPGRSNYLVYVNRSQIDKLHGTFAGIGRWFMQRRLKAEAGNVLDQLRHRLESGEPPGATDHR